MLRILRRRMSNKRGGWNNGKLSRYNFVIDNNVEFVFSVSQCQSSSFIPTKGREKCILNKLKNAFHSNTQSDSIHRPCHWPWLHFIVSSHLIAYRWYDRRTYDNKSIPATTTTLIETYKTPLHDKTIYLSDTPCFRIDSNDHFPIIICINCSWQHRL